MKHLTILSVSVAAILFTGAQFQNRFNKIYAQGKKVEKTVVAKVNETKTKSDSLLISTGTAVTLKTVNKVEKNACNIIGKIVQSVF
jgi:hypothetical protein